MKILNILNIICVFLLSIVKSQTNKDYLNSYKCTGETKGLTIGKSVFVCLHFYPRLYRLAFNVTVDQYSVLTATGAYSYASKDSYNENNFVFQMGNATTYVPSIYFNREKKYVMPVFNVVIKLENGYVKDVVWDNDCFSCLTSEDCITVNNFYYIDGTKSNETYNNCKQNLCTADTTDSLNCDPKFYITWFGTDANGKQLKSSNLSMSRFRQYAVGSLYNSAKWAFNTTITTLENTWNQVKNKTEDIINGKFS